MSNKKSLRNTEKYFSKALSQLDKKTIESLNIYQKSSSILERTNIVLGRKALYKNVTSSTLDTPITKEIFSSTYEV